MSTPYEIFVLIKQVPDWRSKAGLNPDGTVDRAKAKRMLNPFDRYALQAALYTKKKYGGNVTAISMGPPAAVEVLLESLEHGVDRGILLSDRRLAASDTLATAYALHKVVKWLGKFDLIFCGLQTTDGDTAQVGPQLAERLELPQVTYCEDFEIEQEIKKGIGQNRAKARRIIEGGVQYISSEFPLLVTVANSYHPLEYKSFRGAWKVQWLQRNQEELQKCITTVDLDLVQADPERCGLKGSPTIVAHTDKVGDIGGSCKMYEGQSISDMVSEIVKHTNIREFVKA